MAKELTLEQATENYEKAKKAASSKWKEITAMQKEHKVAPGKAPADKKAAKAYAALKEEHNALKVKRDEAETEMKALKPATTVVRSKYTYPDDIVSAEDKKRYRTQQRAAAAKDAKGETADKPSKKDKKAKKSEAPAEPKAEKVSKKSKKAKKSVEADEDED